MGQKGLQWSPASKASLQGKSLVLRVLSLNLSTMSDLFHPVWKRRKDLNNILEEPEGDHLARAGFVGGEGKLGRSLGWEGLSRMGRPEL